MIPGPDKRQATDLQKKGEKIGELLGLTKVPLYNMAWKETRLQLPGNGECYPLIDVIERIAELLSANTLVGDTVEDVKPKPRRGRKPKVKE